MKKLPCKLGVLLVEPSSGDEIFHQQFGGFSPLLAVVHTVAMVVIVQRCLSHRIHPAVVYLGPQVLVGVL